MGPGLYKKQMCTVSAPWLAGGQRMLLIRIQPLNLKLHIMLRLSNEANMKSEKCPRKTKNSNFRIQSIIHRKKLLKFDTIAIRYGHGKTPKL